jgi:hypothetical protein
VRDQRRRSFDVTGEEIQEKWPGCKGSSHCGTSVDQRASYEKRKEKVC